MAQPKPSQHKQGKIEAEPGAEKRLANILKKALNTPPTRHADTERQKQKKGRS